MKNRKPAFERQNFFYAKNGFSKILIALKDVKIKFRMIKKKCSPFSDTVFNKIDLIPFGPGYGLH